MIETPYLLFLGDAPDQLAAKVAVGIKDWRPENAVGQYRMEGCKADLGLTDMSLVEAREAGAMTWRSDPDRAHPATGCADPKPGQTLPPTP